ncbi:RecB-like helicase [Campylobacter coli]|nr:RecB-like helicase [Campylobacter coli]
MKFKPFLALEASAGSGKTFALSVRFVALILQGAKINEILALTFTKKASNEMKKRIIDTFLNLEKESKKSERKELCELLGCEEDELILLRDKKKQEFLRQELKIGTFDSFFSRILRAFALNLGLSSDFDTSEEKLDIRAVFLKLLNRQELKDLAYYKVSLEDNHDFFEELENFYENACFKECVKIPNPSKASIYQAYDDLRVYCLSLDHVKGYKYLCTHFKDEVLQLSQFAKSDLLNLTGAPKYLQELEDSDVKFSQKRKAFIKALDTYAKELEEYKIANLMNLLSHFSKAKDIIQKDKNTLSFSDISRRVLDLIRSDFKDMIYFRLDGYISHLLIDEFQDTSVLQYQILRPLIAELVSGEGVKKNRTFFYVGDKKQSIYRFRKGKKELFDLLQTEFKQIQKDQLTTNYRSRQILVDFVNETFKNKIKDYTPQLSLESKKGGFVRVIESQETEVKKDKAKEIKSKTLEALLEQLKFLKSKNIIYDDICILCWKNNDADMILDFLHEQDIPAFTQSNILLENKACVRVLLEYAKYCIFGDEFYLHFLKEMLGFEPLKLKLDLAKSAVQNVLYLIKELKLDLNDMALIQFIEYAKSKDDFLKLLFEPCTLKIMSEQNRGVNIMTVHKSKGLEFDHVILLDSLSKNNPDNKTIMLEYDIDQGWEFHIKDSYRKATQESEYKAFIDKIEKADYEDDINKLYVAFTRAKDSLIIIKRNSSFQNGNYPSYLNTMLDIEIQELGEIEIQTNDTHLPQKESFQALKEFEKIPLQDIERKKIINSDEIYFGNAFHFFMQNLKLPQGENFDILCQKVSGKFRHFLNHDDFEKLFKRIKNLLTNAQFQKLIENKKLLKEQALSFQGEIKQLDLLALDEDEAIIIDYKTGLNLNEHKKQILLYKEAIEKILAKKSTQAFLVYVLEDKVELIEVY